MVDGNQEQHRLQVAKHTEENQMPMPALFCSNR